MSPRISILALFVLGLGWASAQGQESIEERLVCPEVVLQNRDQLGLSGEQVDKIHQIIKDAQPKQLELEARFGKASAVLAKLLDADKVDSSSTLKQLDNVITVENEQRRMQFELMVELRNLLSKDQRKFALDLQRQAGREPLRSETESRLKAKVERIQKQIQKMAQAGNPPEDAGEKMNEFPTLMQRGNVEQAEALLDSVANMLGLKVDNPSQPSSKQAIIQQKAQRIQKLAQQMQASSEDVSGIQKLMRQIGPLMQRGRMAEAELLMDKALKLGGADISDAETAFKTFTPSTIKRVPRQLPGTELSRFTPSEIGAEVLAMREEEVAWRKIAWRTCLLDGIKASRAQKKPMILWAFIDRPIDDERC